MKRGVVVNAAALWMVLCSTAGAQPVNQSGSQQSLDITLTRYLVDARGEPIGSPAQTIRYRLSRVRTDNGWKTVMTLGAPDGVAPTEIARNPFFGGRVEFDPSGTVSLFDQHGRPVRAPDDVGVSPLVMMNGDWSQTLDGLSTDAASRAARLQEFEARFGRQSAKVRGLTQYLRRGPDEAEELLVDDRHAVPVEMNIMQGNQLRGHLGFEYVEAPGQKLRRKSTRSEFVVNEDGHRSVTIAEFSQARAEEEK